MPPKPVKGDKAVEQQGHAYGIHHLVQDEHWPHRFGEQADLAEQQGGGENGKQGGEQEDRYAGVAEVLAELSAVEEVIVIRQVPAPPQDANDEVIEQGVNAGGF